ncbi:peptidylprolyl isomerase [Basilea psittacipulmonis]|uniref:peptidylprolyl isomerase n=1 Tax=Basilea psittacipulmonis TaxID=1472345 RepID=UPI000690B12C|nr:peptidylprolyl isomerase [Basilea psittacipulmonis]
MKKILTVVLSGLILSTAHAATPEFNPDVLKGLKDNEPYITVNGKPAITVGAYREVLENASGGAPARADAISEELVNQIVDTELFYQAAMAAKFDQNPMYPSLIHAAVANAWTQEYASQIKPTEAEIKAFYEKEIVTPTKGQKEYQVRHILVKDEATAKKLIADLQKKRITFANAAKQSIDQGTAKTGGELGWNNPDGTFVPEFAEAVKNSPVGKINPKPVKTQFGYHVVEVEGVRDFQVPALDSVKSRIEQVLVQQKMREYLEELRQKAKVDVTQPKK